MDKSMNGANIIIEKKKQAMVAKVWGGAASVVTGGLALYNAAMIWEAVKGMMLTYQINALLAGTFTNNTTQLTGIVRLVDMVSGIVLVIGWLVFVLMMNGKYEKCAMKKRLPNTLMAVTGGQLVLLAVSLAVGGIFGGQIVNMMLIVQGVTAAVAGLAMMVLPKVMKAKA